MPHIEWFKAALKEGHISKEVYEKIMWQNINKAINLGL
jgi:predicted TIM-barrel fold metal-dependent hydrolase